jgi:3',5'-cyclic-AMP phosphodiesterase
VAALTLIAQLSDPHIDDDPRSSEALAAAVRAVLALDRAPDAVLVSGDLANLGDARSYERARELLAPLGLPIHVLPGNHDDRDELRAWFPEPGGAGAAGSPFRYVVECGAVRLVVCDTTQPGRDDGRLDEDALAWLAAAVSADDGRPAIVAMHHPPLLTGVAALDALGLPAADRRAFADVVAAAPSVRLVVAGHVHRGAFGAVGGRPVMTCPSVYLQARLSLAGSPEIVLEPAPPAIGVHVLLDGGEIVSHVHAV